MKLRSKKTGDAVYVDFQIPLSNGNNVLGAYSVTSLKELNESFEDYKPTEPLIKDEKIRKAVRAWAKANEAFWASTYESCSDGHYWYIRAFNDTERGIDIDFWGELPKELIDCKCYTITELCGEE